MKHNTISLRRRHLMIAGLAGVAAPATLLAAQRSGTPLEAPIATLSATASGDAEKLVVSGRVLGPDGKPLAGATVDFWHANPNGDHASVTTDADGRFMVATIAPAEYSDRPRPIHYRASHKGHVRPPMQLYFAPERGVSEDLVAQLQRDETGAWRAAFGLTLA